MQRLKKQREENEKKRAEAAIPSSSVTENVAPIAEAKAEETTQEGEVKLFGIGGRGVRTEGDGAKPSRKISPGEIRIQKGAI
jgi:hypothetical protein